MGQETYVRGFCKAAAAHGANPEKLAMIKSASPALLRLLRFAPAAMKAVRAAGSAAAGAARRAGPAVSEAAKGAWGAVRKPFVAADKVTSGLANAVGMPWLGKWGPRASLAGFGARVADVATGFSEGRRSDSPAAKSAKGVARLAPYTQYLNPGGVALFQGANALGDAALSPLVERGVSKLVPPDRIRRAAKALEGSDRKAYAALLAVGAGSRGLHDTDDKIDAALKWYNLARKASSDKFPKVDRDEMMDNYRRGRAMLQENIAKGLESSDSLWLRYLGKTVNRFPDYFGNLFERIETGNHMKPAIGKPFFVFPAAKRGLGRSMLKTMGELVDEQLDPDDVSNIARGAWGLVNTGAKMLAPGEKGTSGQPTEN